MLLQALTAQAAVNDAIMTPTVAHNVTGTATPLGYTAYPHTDLHSSSNSYDLITSNGSCFTTSDLTPNMTYVNNCVAEHKQFCCVKYTDLTTSVVSCSWPSQHCIDLAPASSTHYWTGPATAMSLPDLNMLLWNSCITGVLASILWHHSCHLIPASYTALKCQAESTPDL